MRGRQPVSRLWTRVSSPLITRVFGLESSCLIDVRQRRHYGAVQFSPDVPVSVDSKDGARSRQEVGATRTAPKGGGDISKERLEKEGVQGLSELDRRGAQASWKRYARLLQECANAKSLAEGRKVHDHMRSNQYKPDIYLSNMLISMYAKCGSIEEAYSVFQAMEYKDVISWNAMISGFALHGRGQEAIDHFYLMQRQGLKPNKNTFVSILSAIGSPIVLDLGEQIHSRIIKAGFEADVTVGTALINMYCKCGSVELARKVFNGMRERNVISWTAMISGYAQQGNSDEAFLLFRKLVRSGIQPNKISFASILGACTSPKDLEQGQEFHEYIKRAGLEQELIVGNALISMYARCGNLSNARQVFDNMQSHNRISWNAMIAGYGGGYMEEAFRLFKRMQQKGFQPDRFTYSSLLAICADRADLERGKELHSQIVRTGWLSDVTVATALISMYIKCGLLEEAREVFNKMPEKNVVSWNAFIAGCCRLGSEKEALKVYRQMRRADVSPDHVTFITLLNACSGPEALEEGRFVHDRIVKWGMLSNNNVANALISMYGRCGSLADAREVFYRIRTRDLGSWNAMIATYVQHGANEAAFELFRKFRRERGRGDKYTFISVLKAIANLGDLDAGRKVHALVEKNGLGEDIQILTTLIRMYSKCGSLADACSAFNKILERDAVCWNAMLAAYVQGGHCQDALKWFQLMQSEGVKPDIATYTCILNACAGLGALEHGKNIHTQLKEDGLEADIRISNALIEMYSQCGCLGSAILVFKKMPKRDLNSWNALIAGYSQNGQGSDALKYYELMLRAGFLPNKTTFTSVLSSYGQLGEVDDAFDFLESIKEEWDFEPSEEHYARMVDGLGRAGLVKEAEEFIEEISTESTASMWESLLGACRIHHNVELAETAAEHLLDAKAQASPAVCEQLLSVYTAAGRWEDVSVIKATMEESGIVVPKRCTIEVNGEFHTFTINDPNPELDSSQNMLDELVNEMMDKGFLLEMMDKGFLLEPQERGVLFSHCPEMLAVAYALNHTPPGAPVRCVSDTRVADLSHKMLKFVSRTCNRNIFVRDANCFHNFRPGHACSCGDYW
ncbi:hypothetical protein M758_1G288800 [Ceratodon purpureus]|nr:hypothetical protein M758_1G288800 [Ceratodon purpureus]